MVPYKVKKVFYLSQTNIPLCRAGYHRTNWLMAPRFNPLVSDRFDCEGVTHTETLFLLVFVGISSFVSFWSFQCVADLTKIWLIQSIYAVSFIDCPSLSVRVSACQPELSTCHAVVLQFFKMKCIKMTREKPKWTTYNVFHINWKLFGLFRLPVGLLVTIQAASNAHTWKLPNNENLKYSNINSIWVYWISYTRMYLLALCRAGRSFIFVFFLFVFSEFVCESVVAQMGI